VESYGESKMIVIQFRTLGACFFLNEPLRHFTDKYVELDCVFNNEADETWERLQESKTIPEKFLLAERFLKGKFSADKIPAGKLVSSVSSLSAPGNPASVEAICKEHRVSRKHLNFLFCEYLGVSPKMLFSLNRFQAILHTISRSKLEKLTDIAYELDFYDQAHFNNNFKRFTGLKPNEYIKKAESNPSLKLIPHFLPAG
jgi:AraC-like DNA-binding protein